MTPLEALSSYQVDTWLDEQAPNPWDWLSNVLLQRAEELDREAAEHTYEDRQLRDLAEELAEVGRGVTS